MPEYWTDDSKIARRVVESLPEGVKGSVAVDADFHHPVDLAEMLKGYDLVIATRMHMAILALGAGTPVMPIAYEFKMDELFRRLGHGQWVQDIESINGESLIKAVDSFLESMPQIRGTLFTAVQKERESALESAGLVKKAFNQWQHSKRLREDLRSRQRVEA
jgi:colanic acid/amylovoran biosynthesis protein